MTDMFSTLCEYIPEDYWTSLFDELFIRLVRFLLWVKALFQRKRENTRLLLNKCMSILPTSRTPKTPTPTSKSNRYAVKKYKYIKIL